MVRFSMMGTFTIHYDEAKMEIMQPTVNLFTFMKAYSDFTG